MSIHKNTSHLLYVLVFLLFGLAGSVFTRFNLPEYYEVHTKEKAHLSYKTISSANYIEQLVGPYYPDQIVDIFVIKSPIEDIINDYAIVTEGDNPDLVFYLSDKRIVRLFLRELNRYNSSILKENYDIKIRSYNNQIRELDDKIDTIRKKFSCSIKNDLYGKIFNEYINEKISYIRLSGVLNLIKSFHGNQQSLLSIPEIYKDPLIQKLVDSRPKCNRLHPCNADSDDFSKKQLLNQQLNQQINISVDKIKSRVNILKNTVEQLNSDLQYLKYPVSQFDELFDSLQTVLSSKLQIIAKVDKMKQDLDKLSNNSSFYVIRSHAYIGLCNLFIAIFSASVIFIFFKILCSLLKTGNIFKKNRCLVTLEDVVNNFNSKSIAFFSNKSQVAAGRFLISFCELNPNLRAILINFSSNALNQEYTLKSIVVDKVPLSKAIRTDCSNKVDIISGYDLSQDFTSDLLPEFENVISSIINQYDLVVFSISSEIAIPLGSFITEDTDIVITSVSPINMEANNWYQIFNKLGFKKISFINITDL